VTSCREQASLQLQDLTSRAGEAEGHGHLKAVALRTYADQKAAPVSDEQITDFLPLVNSIARRVANYLRPPLSFEDLVSAGTIGLLKAARDFDGRFGASFKTYAYIRIKGAVLDELRSVSMLPTHLNKQVKELVELSQRIMDETGLPPTDDELARRLGLSRDQVYELQDSARAQRFLSLQAGDEDSPSLESGLCANGVESPDQEMERAELIDSMSAAIGALDEKRRRIVVLYYQQHLTMRQIAEVLGITESRVSQLHASALFNLSANLREWRDGFE
jgi:RNA polymerase sigma factor for flagellar operon FliA